MVDRTGHTVPTDDELQRLLVALAERMRQSFFTRLQAEQLSPPQFAMLRILDEPRSMGAVGQELFCDASNVTGMADRLNERGLLERRLAPSDRRVRLLVLTAKGRRLRARLEQGMIPDLPGLAALSDAERAELRRLLAAVLDERGDAPAPRARRTLAPDRRGPAS